MTTTVVLVPRRSDRGGHRDRTWAFLARRWAVEHPRFTVVEGHHHGGPFNRAAALNEAARAAGPWDVAVIADADIAIDASPIHAGIVAATRNGRMTLPYDRFCFVSRGGSEAIRGGYAGCREPFVEWTLTDTCSSAVIVTRALWDRVGGFDEGFVGWGFEDVGFSLACQAAAGGLNRLPGTVWHLWHPRSAENDRTSPLWQANQARMHRYAAAAGDPDRIAALRSEVRCAT